VASRPLAVVVGISVAAAGAYAEGAAEPEVGWLGVLDWAVGAVFALAAMRLWSRDTRAAAISLLVAMTWYVGTLSAAPGSLGRLGTALVLAYRAPVLHLLARTSPTRAGLLLTLTTYAAVIAPSAVAGPTTAGIAVLIGADCARTSVRAPADQRRAARLAAVLSLALAGVWVEATASLIPDQPRTVLLAGVLGCVGWLVVRNVGTAGMLDALSDLLVDLGPQRRAPAPISAVLAEALGSPGLVVLYHSPGLGWVDELGRASLPPPSTAVRASTPDGGEIALAGGSRDLSHSELAPTAAAAAGLALAGARLAAEARARGQTTRASRRRLLEVGDTERRGIEQRLRDGPLSRLALVRQSLETAPAADAPLLAAEFGAALLELETLAQGLYPSKLLEQPLDKVLRGLVSDLDLAAGVSVSGPAEDLGAAERALAYFFCAECVTNVNRHAPSASISLHIDVTDHQLSLKMTDDGPGGAMIHRGGGLQGLSDRVATMGGDFAIVSPVGGPTSIRARVPVGDDGAEHGPG
jgi:signal transduction histidine kinase